MSKIQLNTSCILNLPFQNYDKDFTFIVNGKEFKASSVFSDILSPKISQIHKNDPTFDRYTINTTNRGDFSIFFKLMNFNENPISKSEIPFIIEVIENLCNNSISLQIEDEPTNLSINNVLTNIQEHLKYPLFYTQKVQQEIDFISSHFYELIENQKEEIKKLDVYTLKRILENDHLQLNDEDQLLKFINSIYANDNKYSFLYETVIFKNVSCDIIQEFRQIFDYNDLSGNTWISICDRFVEEIKFEIKDKKRYKSEVRSQKGQIFLPNEHGEFSGIINYLKSQSPNNTENVVNVTASSVSSSSCSPVNLINYQSKEQYYSQYQSDQNVWVLFDFKDHQIIPTDYTIRSTNYGGKDSHYHPRNWVLEISNDNVKWDTIDKQIDCPYLNNQFVVHTFKIQHTPRKEVRYIRLRQTGVNWYNNENYLAFDSFEVYGTLI
ncbi:hypothetical protein M9Y10_024374 [Tritrichomonas musculus]|uniref:BACK domain-containing protein n=1 Tax=Tritrichomonas musculus TaxID=1915356 RepID=A0ABR2HDL4_9EUKA